MTDGVNGLYYGATYASLTREPRFKRQSSLSSLVPFGSCPAPTWIGPVESVLDAIEENMNNKRILHDEKREAE